MGALPQSAEGFTVDWLNQAMTESGVLGDYRVASVKVLDSDIPGQTAEIAQLEVEYDSDACPLPNRLIAKYTSKNPDLIETVINAYQQYWRETSFYVELPEVGIARPRCLYAKHVPDSQEFVLLMNDLAPAESPSWAATPEQVVEAAAHLPGMHARFWNDAMLKEKDWLVQIENRDFYKVSAAAALGAVPKIREVFGTGAEATIEAFAYYADNIDTVLDYLETRPYTLVHGDYHPKQMFFPTDKGGEFAVIDWQFSFVAPGPLDLARITVTGQNTGDRRANEPSILDTYLSGLKASGVADYSRESLEDDYRFGILVNQLIMMVATGDTDISIFERECEALGMDYRDILMLRGESAVQEWDLLDYLKRVTN